MKPKDWFLWVVEAILWYAALYLAFYTIKSDVNLFQNALIILILAYGASVACPLIRHSGAWKATWQKNDTSAHK